MGSWLSCSEPLEDHMGHPPQLPCPTSPPLGGRKLEHLVTVSSSLWRATLGWEELWSGPPTCRTGPQGQEGIENVSSSTVGNLQCLQTWVMYQQYLLETPNHQYNLPIQRYNLPIHRLHVSFIHPPAGLLKNLKQGIVSGMNL